MSRKRPPSLINVWTILGAILVAGCLMAVTLLLIGATRPRQPGDAGFVPADITVIPPSTLTPSPAPSATPAGTAAANGQIGIGSYVQITGTEGAGLRIRSAPGLASDTVFRGEEAETFKVADGPQQADGYTWWKLVAPYDESRTGWAAAEFLAVVPPP
ncbi:MAG TPA: hypothetical protein VMJ64_10115 [Anaerolineales bacterium]|nr:hypothetical protein [Anaerolineales bacterium]